MFNTEAHPIDTAALYCCSADKERDDLELIEQHHNMDLLDLFDLLPADEEASNKQKNKYFDQYDMDNIYNELNINWAKAPDKPKQEFSKIILPNTETSRTVKASVPVSTTDTPAPTLETILAALSNTLEKFKLDTNSDLKLNRPAASSRSVKKALHLGKSVPLTPIAKTPPTTTDSLQSTCALPGATHEHVDSPFCSPSDHTPHTNKIVKDLTWKYTTLMSCPAQPYYMKYSLMGEFFDIQT